MNFFDIHKRKRMFAQFSYLDCLLYIGAMLYARVLYEPTDQPKKKALFFARLAAEHPLREINFFAEKNKNPLFCLGFSQRNFAEKLRESSRRNSEKFRGETPRHFAEKLREISRWVGKDLRLLHADKEDSDRTKKLSECPA